MFYIMLSFHVNNRLSITHFNFAVMNFKSIVLFNITKEIVPLYFMSVICVWIASQLAAT